MSFMKDKDWGPYKLWDDKVVCQVNAMLHSGLDAGSKILQEKLAKTNKVCSLISNTASMLIFWFP